MWLNPHLNTWIVAIMENSNADFDKLMVSLSIWHIYIYVEGMQLTCLPLVNMAAIRSIGVSIILVDLI